MTSARDQAKKILAAIEPLQRTLQTGDETWPEIDRVEGVLAARKTELAEVEAQLVREKAAAQETTTALDLLSQTSAKEEARIATKINHLNAEMLELEKAVGERRLELDSITAGMAALQRRLTGNAA